MRRLVRERPGITVAEMASELGVDATGLYGIVRRLQEKGQISKDGTRLRPADVSPERRDDSATTQPGERASAAIEPPPQRPAEPSASES